MTIKEYKLGNIEFSQWTKFDKMEDLKDVTKHAGVYALSTFERMPDSSATDLSENIFYIGETTSQTLWTRLGAFRRSAFKNAKGHSGGSCFFKEYLHHETNGHEMSQDNKKEITDTLCVSIMPFSDYNEIQRKAYILFVERLLILEFTKKHGEYPWCNRK